MSEQKEYSWPQERVDLDAVRSWIGAQFPAGAEVTGPSPIYRANGWGVTARFTVQAPGAANREVVCKIGFLPVFRHSPSVYVLLGESAPTETPKLLASEVRDEQTWMLFKPFAGESVREIGTLDALLDLARMTAKVQAKVAETLLEEGMERWAAIPKVELKDMPALYESLMQDVRETYLPVWQTQGEQLAQDFGLSPHSLARIAAPATLEALGREVAELAADLQQGGWPLSIYHIDLHAGNAVRKPDGDTLIYDWEEATISCPFFAVEKLLDDARRFDAADAKIMRTFHGLIYSESQMAVRKAYLDALPWKTLRERERSFDLSLLLAPIKYAYQSRFFLNQVGWGDSAAGFIAESFVQAYERWAAYRI